MQNNINMIFKLMIELERKLTNMRQLSIINPITFNFNIGTINPWRGSVAKNCILKQLTNKM